VSYKATLPISSTHAPAMAVFNGHRYLAYVDEQRGLNVAKLARDIDEILHPPHLPAPEFHPLAHSGLEREKTIGQPALVEFNGSLVLAWTGIDGSGHLNVISSTDGVHWDPQTKRTSSELSVAGPALAVYEGQLYAAWTGVDGDGTLTVMSSSNGLDFANRRVLSDCHSIDGSPSLAVQQSLTSPIERNLLIGWTERNTDKVSFGLIVRDGKPINDHGGSFLFSNTGDPDHRGSTELHSRVPPSLLGGFGVTVVWVDDREGHMLSTSWDLGSPGLGSLWSDPIEFADATDRPPALLPSGLDGAEVAWRGLDGKHRLNISETRAMPMA
jgi:hypothetical protein